MADKQTYANLSSLLTSLGLGSLMSTDGAGNPQGWLVDQIAQGVDTPEELYAAIEQTDVFRQRYAVITEQRQRAAAGEVVTVLTPVQVRQNEERFKQLATYYGIPTGAYDYKDWQALMAKGVTPEAFEQSSLRAWQRVQSAPAAVKQVFGEWFGPQGDGMLAAYFLDPTHMTANLERITSAAVAGGYARRYGFSLSQQQAFELADRAIADSDLATGFANIQARSDVFRESATETTDLQAGREGVQAQFSLDGESVRKIESRLEQRAAAFGGSGGAGRSSRGVVGVGAAE